MSYSRYQHICTSRTRAGFSSFQTLAHFKLHHEYVTVFTNTCTKLLKYTIKLKEFQGPYVLEFHLKSTKKDF
jgi:hypothetical protein